MTRLLSPAGNPACLIAGVRNGADEIYLGLSEFSARAGAENFTLESLGEWVRYAHVRGVRIHVALNTLLTDRELDRAASLAFAADSLGVDAFIIQDTALAARLAGKTGAELHASTQMSVMNVHGALCVSYSGQCMLSAAVSGRSGNRGTCSQPCRLKYKNVRPSGSEKDGGFKYMLSPADLCTLPYLEKLTATGVTSLKIEGRLKSPEYVAAVTSAYRRALDNPGADVTDDVKKLTVIFSRGGFCSGHQLGKLSTDDITYSYPGKTGLKCGYVTGRAVAVKGPVSIFKMPVRITENLACGDGICFSGNPEAGGVVNVIESGGVRKDVLKAGESGTVTVSGTFDPASTEIYKTLDFAYNKEIARTLAPAFEPKRVKITASLSLENSSAVLTLSDGKNNVSASCDALASDSAGAQDFREKAAEIISATGGTPYEVTSADISGETGFVTFSALKKLRRDAVAALSASRERRGSF